MRSRTRASAALIAAVALAGCSSTATSSTPGGSASEQAVALPATYLRAGEDVFDLATDSAPGTEVCDGLPGREVLERFDRAAWPELGVPAGEGILICGNADGAGWRHIADGHTGDFGEVGELVGAEWSDVARWSIDQALEAPTRVEEYRSDIVNYDVAVELVEDREVTREWMVTVGVGLDTGNVITAFPDEQ